MAELTRYELINAKQLGAGIVIRVTGTKGSSPRGVGSLILVEPDKISGTIGGGQAEWIAISRARQMLAGENLDPHFTLALGPEIGQCCGGVMELEFISAEQINIDELITNESSQCLIFGAGHTGSALANAFSAFDFDITIIDTRPEYESRGDSVIISALPEILVRDANTASIFLITTHEHSLDFLITAEALKREDAAYVGMIGSKSKRAGFKSWLKDNGYDNALEEKLHCPIGGKVKLATKDPKRPAVIAAMTVVEVLNALA